MSMIENQYNEDIRKGQLVDKILTKKMIFDGIGI